MRASYRIQGCLVEGRFISRSLTTSPCKFGLRGQAQIRKPDPAVLQQDLAARKAEAAARAQEAERATQQFRTMQVPWVELCLGSTVNASRKVTGGLSDHQALFSPRTLRYGPEKYIRMQCNAASRCAAVPHRAGGRGQPADARAVHGGPGDDGGRAGALAPGRGPGSSPAVARSVCAGWLCSVRLFLPFLFWPVLFPRRSAVGLKCSLSAGRWTRSDACSSSIGSRLGGSKA